MNEPIEVSLTTPVEPILDFDKARFADTRSADGLPRWLSGQCEARRNTGCIETEAKWG
jgi:hypothetical protein